MELSRAELSVELSRALSYHITYHICLVYHLYHYVNYVVYSASHLVYSKSISDSFVRRRVCNLVALSAELSEAGA